MRRFKLIKEYPGSGDLGDIAKLYENHHYVVPHPKKYCDGLAVPKSDIENQPEYWEEILEVFFMVPLTDMPFHNAWEPIKISDIKHDTDTRKYFSTEEGAKSFIIHNKPCLSFNDVKEQVKNSNTPLCTISNIYHIVKSRI